MHELLTLSWKGNGGGSILGGAVTVACLSGCIVSCYTSSELLPEKHVQTLAGSQCRTCLPWKGEDCGPCDEINGLHDAFILVA